MLLTNQKKFICWAPGANCGDNLSQAVCVELRERNDALNGFCPPPNTPIPKQNYFTYNPNTKILTLYQATSGANCSVVYTSSAIDLNTIGGGSSGNAYDISMYVYGYIYGGVLMRYVAPRSFSISAADPGRASAVTGPAQNWSAQIRKNGTQIGTITFASNSTTGLVSISSNQTFAPGDVLDIYAANADIALKDVVIVIKGSTI